MHCTCFNTIYASCESRDTILVMASVHFAWIVFCPPQSTYHTTYYRTDELFHRNGMETLYCHICTTAGLDAGMYTPSNLLKTATLPLFSKMNTFPFECLKRRYRTCIKHKEGTHQTYVSTTSQYRKESVCVCVRACACVCVYIQCLYSLTWWLWWVLAVCQHGDTSSTWPQQSAHTGYKGPAYTHDCSQSHGDIMYDPHWSAKLLQIQHFPGLQYMIEYHTKLWGKRGMYMHSVLHYQFSAYGIIP